MKHIILYIIIGITLLSCSERQEYVDRLEQAKSLLDEHPDSALQILDRLGTNEQDFSKSFRMKYQLLKLQAQNKAFVDFTSDSIAKDLVSYYDRNGNANERMMAHYLLGCVYRDLGEAPKAVDCYLEAINKADTAKSDCDFQALSAVYAQMANEFYNQLLLSESIETYKKACRYSIEAKDTFHYILNTEKMASAYILQNKKDSAEAISMKCMRLYSQRGYVQEALLSSLRLIHMYVQDKDKLSDAKKLLDNFEEKTNLFDDDHELPMSKRSYYYYKGRYYEGVSLLDSAEYYYRKSARPNMSYTALNSMYKGLLSVYQKRNKADSIVKYAKLYCDVNDSSIAKKDQDIIEQMAKSYNYHHIQEEALANELKANRLNSALITVVTLTILFMLFLIKKYNTNKKKKQEEIEKLKDAYSYAVDNYNKNLRTVGVLESVHKEVISTIQSELNQEKEKANDYWRRINEVERKYNELKSDLENENDFLKEEIKELRLHSNLKNDIEKSITFIDKEIVKRIKYLAEHSKLYVSGKEWDCLITEASKYYPKLINDLNKSDKISENEIRACILVIIGIRESDIARFLGVSPQRITNIKATINHVLFNENSARTLYKNIQRRYNIYSS